MSLPEFENLFGDTPRLDVIDEKLGERRLLASELAISHQWAVEQASGLCTEVIEPVYSGGLVYNTAFSPSIEYVTGGGKICRLRLALGSGPKGLFDDKPTERVQLGIVDKEDTFMPAITLGSDTIKDGELLFTRVNDPADLHCLVRAIKFFSDKLTD
ncbi:MAG: hypothetical protein JWS12_671 [Candidatus Saccharibacteria bacterium]|nr:hypothetical protein [Candidatus Saccharibacteria bacterium]